MNWKAILLAVMATLIDPVTVTFNEVAEGYDSIEKTRLDPDYIIRAWGRWLTIVLGGGYLLAAKGKESTTT